MLHLLVVASTAPAKPEITQCNAARHGSDPGATATHLIITLFSLTSIWKVHFSSQPLMLFGGNLGQKLPLITETAKVMLFCIGLWVRTDQVVFERNLILRQLSAAATTISLSTNNSCTNFTLADARTNNRWKMTKAWLYKFIALESCSFVVQSEEVRKKTFPSKTKERWQLD